MELLNGSSDEWLDMWADLADDPMNKGDAQCPCMGVSWEYMGSTQNHHHFRHLKHPASYKTEYAYLERKQKAVGWI